MMINHSNFPRNRSFLECGTLGAETGRVLGKLGWFSHLGPFDKELSLVEGCIQHGQSSGLELAHPTGLTKWETVSNSTF